jgi:hypothetical protein
VLHRFRVGGFNAVEKTAAAIAAMPELSGLTEVRDTCRMAAAKVSSYPVTARSSGMSRPQSAAADNAPTAAEVIDGGDRRQWFAATEQLGRSAVPESSVKSASAMTISSSSPWCSIAAR